MCIREWSHTHLGGHTTGDRNTNNVHRGCVSGQPRANCYDKWM